MLLMKFYDGMIIFVNWYVDYVELDCCKEQFYCFYYNVVVQIVV